MKILKIYSLILGGIVLLNMGFYLKNTEIIRFNPRIAPEEKWEEILTTRWRFEVEELHTAENIYYQGEVEFFSDGTFKRYVTYESFYKIDPYHEVGPRNKRSFLPDKPDLVANGSVKGVWEIGNGGFWKETASDCDMMKDYCSRSCEGKDLYYHDAEVNIFSVWCKIFEEGKTFYYGSFEGEDYRSELKKFTKGEIVIERTYFEDNSKATLSFKRLKS